MVRLSPFGHDFSFVLFSNFVCAVFPPRHGWQYNIHKSLESLPVEKPKPAVILKAQDVVSCRESCPICKDYG